MAIAVSLNISIKSDKFYGIKFFRNNYFDKTIYNFSISISFFLQFLYHSNMSNTYSVSFQKYSFQVEIHMSITSDTKTYTLIN